jgi:uncharacterized protein (TIGR02001 family)
MLAAFSANVAQAEEAAAPVPEHAVSYNIGVASEYRYRGISQSSFDPAVNAGADYTHNPSGFYIGAWASSIKWIKDAGKIQNPPVKTKGEAEIDIYAGKRGEIAPDVTYDLGILQYWYPGNSYDKIGSSADTTELYAQIGYGPSYLKYSHAVTDLFGNKDSSGSYYVDAGVNYPIAEGTVLNLHVGYQKVKKYSDLDYTDWKVGVTKDFGFVTGAIAVIGADVKKTSTGDYAYMSPAGNNLGKTAAVLSLTKAF